MGIPRATFLLPRPNGLWSPKGQKIVQKLIHLPRTGVIRMAKNALILA
jgi:hypothetical protein